MTPQELFLSDGKPAGVWFCSKCKLVHGQLLLAERCCDPKCSKCGVSCQPYYTLCAECLRESHALRERELFKKAQKIPEHEWSGGVFLGETFYSSVDDMRDYESDEDLSHIHYVWSAAPEKFVHIDVDSVIDGILEHGYDGFDSDDINGVAALKQAIDDFNEANRDNLSYSDDKSKAIILKTKL